VAGRRSEEREGRKEESRKGGRNGGEEGEVSKRKREDTIEFNNKMSNSEDNKRYHKD
jgi:hypothetical protein